MTDKITPLAAPQPAEPTEPVRMSRQSQIEHELEAMNRYIQKITKDKNSATAFLTRAGIIDSNGELAQQYRDVEYKMRADKSAQPSKSAPQPAVMTPSELADRIEQGERWAVQEPADIPKLGCVNHDCDKCKAAQPSPPEVEAAWDELPVHIKAHPGVKSLYRAKLAAPQPAESCYCLNCEALSKELAAVKTAQQPLCELEQMNAQLREQNTAVDAACAKLEAANVMLLEVLAWIIEYLDAEPASRKAAHDWSYIAKAVIAKYRSAA